MKLARVCSSTSIHVETWWWPSERPKHVVSAINLAFHHLTSCVLTPLPAHSYCIYVFCIYLRTNRDLCTVWYILTGFYIRGAKCSLRGTNRVFKWNSLLFSSKGLNKIHSLIVNSLWRTKQLFRFWFTHLEDGNSVFEWYHILMIALFCEVTPHRWVISSRSLEGKSFPHIQRSRGLTLTG